MIEVPKNVELHTTNIYESTSGTGIYFDPVTVAIMVILFMIVLGVYTVCIINYHDDSHES